VASLVLAVLTFVDVVAPWHIYLTVLINTSAATFGGPARLALIPALVPRDQLAQAFALINPSREVAVLVGPAVGGLLDDLFQGVCRVS
jgi:predicted MFS family arabinose efflux permease